MLTIRSPEADRLAREIAEATGTSLTEAVTVALRERRARLDAEEAARREAYVERAMKLQRDFLAALGPNRPTREEIDADMYDEHGLPR